MSDDRVIVRHLSPEAREAYEREKKAARDAIEAAKDRPPSPPAAQFIVEPTAIDDDATEGLAKTKAELEAGRARATEEKP